MNVLAGYGFPYSSAEAAAESAHYKKLDDQLVDEITATEKLSRLSFLLAGTTKNRRLTQLRQMQDGESQFMLRRIGNSLMPELVEAAHQEMEQDLASRTPTERPTPSL